MAMPKPSENIRILLRSFITNLVKMSLIVRVLKAALPVFVCLVGVAPAHAAAAARAKKAAASSEKQLEQWCRALKDKDGAASYSKLAAFARSRNAGELGLRAALALGYYDYVKGHYPEAQRWLDKAADDPILREYALYWGAQTIRARNDNAQALARLQGFRREFPNSVMSDQAVQFLAETEIASGQPEEALTALASYPQTSSRPELLFLRGQALEQAKRPEPAAADYVAVYYRFPTSDSAREAGMKAQYLAGVLGDKFPVVPLDQKISRAAALYAVHDWGDARDAYDILIPELSGADRARAQLREVQCRVAIGGDATLLANLKVDDPEADAERLYSLSQTYRSRQQEPDMLATIEEAVRQAPQSHWAEQGLFAAGNYYWVELDRSRAGSYYQRVADNFPASPDAVAAQWRLAWIAHLERRPEAATLFEQYIRKFPASSYVPDALYWLGREAENAGNADLARAYYQKLEDRFAHGYFQQLAQVRVAALGQGPKADPDFLSVIPPRPPAQPLGDSIPPAASEQKKRADALRSIAFDASAELELRAAYAATGEPRLLLEAAEEAANAERYGVATLTARQIYPQLETRPIGEVPDEVWRTAYPLPYAAETRQAAARAGVDPMLAAGLIRQESTFEPNAVSHAGALGLMQLLPKTARRLARQTRMGYSHQRLFDPDYNLRLGCVYLGELKKNFGSVEAALAAYNAGEDHVVQWQTGQKYQETAEFVESIPFTETREYVQIVIRNAEIYRSIYGGGR
jgi:soluble lytic murein transglycosylase